MKSRLINPEHSEGLPLKSEMQLYLVLLDAKQIIKEIGFSTFMFALHDNELTDEHLEAIEKLNERWI